MEAHVEGLVERVSPAVVAVTVGGASGSAVVISENGLVLSAAHVCGAPDRDVLFNFPSGKTARGKTLGTNHERDAGLMKITDPGPWPYVPVGEIGRSQVGAWTLALGHPGGFDAQRPIVARLGRAIILTSRMLQTDCTLLSGDSGGPLFDMSGRVVAIHSRISESTEENYHVPLSAFLENWDRLVQGENWGGRRPSPRPYVGARGVDHPEGCRLERIDENSPAARAGLKAGDIVLRMNNRVIKGYASFVQALARARPGTEIILHVRRNQVEMSVFLTVEARGRRGRGRPNDP